MECVQVGRLSIMLYAAFFVSMVVYIKNTFKEIMYFVVCTNAPNYVCAPRVNINFLLLVEVCVV